MDEDIKRTIEVIEQLETRINAYWNFYVIVVVATIGWLMSDQDPFTVRQGIALTIAVGLFFLANLSVLRAATKRVVAFEDELNATARQKQFSSPVLQAELSRPAMPTRLLASYVLHGVVDIAVIYTIWSKLG